MNEIDEDLCEWKNVDSDLNAEREKRLAFQLKNQKKIEISNQAKHNIYEASTEFTQGNANSLIVLEHLLVSIGFIPDDSFNENIFIALVNFITTEKLTRDFLVSALDLIASLDAESTFRAVSCLDLSSQSHIVIKGYDQS